MATVEVDPWDFVTHILQSPENLDEAKSGRAFGASGARMTATERAEATDRQTVLDRKQQKPEPAAAEKAIPRADKAAAVKERMRAAFAGQSQEVISAAVEGLWELEADSFAPVDYTGDGDE